MTTLRERLLAKVEKAPGPGCWIWVAAIDQNGYGRIGFLGKNRQAHRLSYELFIGEIPKGLELDHLCRVRRCVNPKHLEPVTRRENIRRGDRYAMGSFHRKTVACPKGHPYGTDGFYKIRKVRVGGEESFSRACKLCASPSGKTQSDFRASANPAPGTVIGNWTFIEEVRGPSYDLLWKCKCKCGRICLPNARGVVSGRWKQCRWCARSGPRNRKLRDFCLKGHPMNEEHLSNGASRRCKTCVRDGAIRRRDARRVSN